jgi:hypothetical protein
MTELNYTMLMSRRADDPPFGHDPTMSQQGMGVDVHCHSGYIYAEEPRSFVWQGTELRVESIQSAWREPGKRLFRVATEGGKPFELCYNEADERWSAIELAQ